MAASLLLSHAVESRAKLRIFKLPGGCTYLILRDYNYNTEPAATFLRFPLHTRLFTSTHPQLDYDVTKESAKRAKLSTMTTIAEDLLNDFESDDENDDEQQNGELFADHGYSDEGLVDPSRNLAGASNGDHMELDGDEEQHDDADPDAAAPSHLKMEDAEDEEEAKARIEKMQLASVSDVRSVAGLMRQLEPVMEVSSPNYSLQDEE
jgi:hypothetical protein